MSEISQAREIKGTLDYFKRLENVLSCLPLSEIEATVEELIRAYEGGHNIFLLGNGGSAALASHFACDLGKGTIQDGHTKRFRVMALTDNVPLITAWANDRCYEDVFAEQLRNFLHPQDMIFAISGSGNSPNVLRALEIGLETGAINIGLTGFQGGRMRDLCAPCIVIPSENMQIIEDLHLSVTHAMFSTIKQRISERRPTAVAASVSSYD
jgi:D-sedoheptulose 7-phosphate isomerase